MPKRVTVTGAAGNLGTLLSRHLLATTDRELSLLVHRRAVAADLRASPRVRIVAGDLADTSSVLLALSGADAVIHFAGVLFKGRPESFLPTTNTQYFINLCEAALQSGVKRIVLVSFPHVEGETTPASPATGRLDGQPASMHAKTRLAEERYLFEWAKEKGIEAVSLRVGMVYGRGILMIDAARWLSRRGLLGVWKKPTWIHLIARDDFLQAAANALTLDGIQGIYHVGDEGVQTLQDFLHCAARQWNTRPPRTMSVGLIMLAAQCCEWNSLLLGVQSPLTKDFIRIGMVSYYGDTARMRAELLPALKYPTLETGKAIL